MKTRQSTEDSDDMREEYDFAGMEGGVRGKYAGAFDRTSVTVLLDSDIAEVFPDSQSVDEALRTLMRVLHKRDKSVQYRVNTDSVPAGTE